MNPLQKLTNLFTNFPGVGSRQAGRFAFFLLQSHPQFLDELVESLTSLKGAMHQCLLCYRFYEARQSEHTTCDLCINPQLTNDILMVVARDVDIENMQSSGAYFGKYFVLGGLIPLLDKKYNARVRTDELFQTIEKRARNDGLQEVVIALNANPDGDHTTLHLQKLLQPLTLQHRLKITTLGRGLSTGTELEYSDSDTIKNALENRK